MSVAARGEAGAARVQIKGERFGGEQHAQDGGACRLVRQADFNAAVKAGEDGTVQVVHAVGRRQHEDIAALALDAVQLLQQLADDFLGEGVVCAAARRGDDVYFINEKDARRLAARPLKQVFHQLPALPDISRFQVSGGGTDE